MLKDYSIGLGGYLENIFVDRNIKVIESKKDTAFETLAKHHDSQIMNLPFISFAMTGDVELDYTRYNAFIHRIGKVVYTDTENKVATRVKAIPITHPYSIEFWAPNKDTVSYMRGTFWLSYMDTPIVTIFDRDIDRTYRISIDVPNTSAESVVSVEDRAGYYNSTVNANLGVWIRVPSNIKTISKAIIEYIQSPENLVLSVNEYTS